MVTTVAVAACTESVPPSDPPASPDVLATGEGSVALGNLRVEASDAIRTLSVAAPTLTAEQYGGLRDWLQTGAMAGAPVDVTTPDDLAGDTVRLTREYAAPLPDGAAATLAYYEPALGAWLAVPSEVSTDRRSVTALVDHLSLWTDFVATTEQAGQAFRDNLQRGGQAVNDMASAAYDGVQQFSAAVAQGLSDAGNEMYYAVGTVFDVRVDPPRCDGEAPDWVDSTVSIAADKNNPVLWCTGRDLQNPDLLVVKARINRGFALFGQPATDAAWTWNSTLDQSAFDAALATVTELDAVLAQSVATLTGPGTIVGAGQEIAYGFSEQQVRRVPVGQPLLNLAVPELVPFLTTAAAQLLVQQGVDMADGLLAAVIAVASCSKDVAAATDVLAVARALLTCLTSAQDVVATDIGKALLRRGMGPRAAEKLAGSLVGRISVALGLIGPVFNAMNYAAESNTSQAARSVTVFLRTPKPRRQGTVTLGLGGTLGDLGTYAPEAEAIAFLTDRLGPPSATANDGMCAGGDVPGKRISWGPLTVRIAADATALSYGGAASGPAMMGWEYTASDAGTDPLGLTTAEGLGLGSTLADVRAVYPTATDGSDTDGPYVDVFLGDASNILFQAPDGVRVEGITSGQGCPR